MLVTPEARSREEPGAHAWCRLGEEQSQPRREEVHPCLAAQCWGRAQPHVAMRERLGWRPHVAVRGAPAVEGAIGVSGGAAVEVALHDAGAGGRAQRATGSSQHCD